MEQKFPTKVITGEVRLSYPHLFEKYSNNGNEPKYSVTLLIPKSDAATKQRIDAAIQSAIQQGLANDWAGVKPPIIPIPIHDGDGVRPSDGMPFAAECKGHWVITASSKQPPQVVDAQLQPVMSQTEIYPGVLARVSLNFYPYGGGKTGFKKGVGCGLGNVQKTRDGEPLTSRSTAEDDFGAPVQGYQQPTQPQYQQPQYQNPHPQYQAVDPITGQPL